MLETGFSKTYVRPDGTAVLTCPHCGHQKVILAGSFQGYKHKLKVKCACKETFKVFLEFRRRIRKSVLLKGSYVDHTQNDTKCDVVILDISVIGLTFSSPDMPGVNVGDELSIKVILDDGYHTEIRRDAIVRNIRPTAVGCEFENSGGVLDGPLGYYVMS